MGSYVIELHVGFSVHLSVDTLSVYFTLSATASLLLWLLSCKYLKLNSLGTPVIVTCVIAVIYINQQPTHTQLQNKRSNNDN